MKQKIIKLNRSGKITVLNAIFCVALILATVIVGVLLFAVADRSEADAEAATYRQ